MIIIITSWLFSVSWWSFPWVQVTTSLFKSSGLFSVFWPFSSMLLSIASLFWPSKPLTGLGRIWNHYLLTMLIWCDRQQLWKAVITGDTVRRLSIPIRGRGKITWRRPEVKFGRNVVKEATTQKNYQDEDKKVCNK